LLGDHHACGNVQQHDWIKLGRRRRTLQHAAWKERMMQPRIVSLLASATEIVCALGWEHALVGRSHECDFPPTVKHLPVCTAPKFDPDGTSYAVDQRVKAILQEGLSIYRVDAAQLRALAPTHILTQDHCEVCAVSLKDVEQAVCTWVEGRPQVVSLHPNCLADVWADMRRVAQALGDAAAGDRLVTTLQARLRQRANLVPPARNKPRVACIEWLSPLMAAGNWMPELVELAGGVNVVGIAGQHSPPLSPDELKQANPDLLVLMPCGWDCPKTQQEWAAVKHDPGWQAVRAVQAGQVYVVDGNQYFNRPGPRLVESLEILLEVLHAGTLKFGHQGIAWQLGV